MQLNSGNEILFKFLDNKYFEGISFVAKLKHLNLILMIVKIVLNLFPLLNLGLSGINEPY